MPTLAELLRRALRTPDGADVEWLHLLVGDWQLLSRPVLRRPRPLGAAVAGAVGSRRPRPADHRARWSSSRTWSAIKATRARAEILDQAFAERRDRPRARTPSGATTCPSARSRSPSCAQGRAIAVITRHTNLSMMRTPSRLELTYLATADALVADGRRRASSRTRRRRPACGAAPRGRATGSSASTTTGSSRTRVPNAVSAIHRLGWHVGEVMGGSLAEIVTVGPARLGPGRRGAAAGR